MNSYFIICFATAFISLIKEIADTVILRDAENKFNLLKLNNLRGSSVVKSRVYKFRTIFFIMEISISDDNGLISTPSVIMSFTKIPYLILAS